ncbi:MAG: UDP-N-acetylmuramate dehydrogenase [Firmicutes bacterium]|nr:UDP-N-acetylmuramate dehydrogenase [Bacillota bacterium]
MEQIARKLAAKITGAVRTKEPLCRHTSLKIGGPADLFVEPATREELAFTLACLRQAGVEWFLLGNGTNLLVHDAGFRGAVIRLAGDFCRYEFDGMTIHAGAAVSLAHLAREAVRRGCAGLAFAAGIPGTVGGALVTNAGAHGASLGDVVAEAQIMDESGELHTCLPESLGLAYRKSSIPPAHVVCAVTLQLTAGDREELERQCRDDYLFRRKHQPHQPNAGSIFKNPPGEVAGRLIEAAGLKGCRVGGAVISAIHANFIVNDGQATAADVMALIEKARAEVAGKFGIELELEICLLGY